LVAWSCYVLDASRTSGDSRAAIIVGDAMRGSAWMAVFLLVWRMCRWRLARTQPSCRSIAVEVVDLCNASASPHPTGTRAARAPTSMMEIVTSQLIVYGDGRSCNACERRNKVRCGRLFENAAEEGWFLADSGADVRHRHHPAQSNVPKLLIWEGPLHLLYQLGIRFNRF
jgi:hypothetical protein